MPMKKNIEHYNQNARNFFEGTIKVDVSHLREWFLQYVPDGGTILDAGCGSGRDSMAFAGAGYRVEAFDASCELVKLARQHYKIPVEEKTFQELNEKERYDGIWACASLLHVPMNEMQDVFERLAKSLKPEGVMYASFKLGEGEREHKGRIFTDFTFNSFSAFLKNIPAFQLLEHWITNDVRPGREDEQWLNVIVGKGTAHTIK